MQEGVKGSGVGAFYFREGAQQGFRNGAGHDGVVGYARGFAADFKVAALDTPPLVL